MPARTASGAHRTHEKQQRALKSPHLGRDLAYPRITESDPVLHSVPKGLKAQVSIIPEVAGHAHILPPTVLRLEQLQSREERSRGPRETAGADWPSVVTTV